MSVLPQIDRIPEDEMEYAYSYDFIAAFSLCHFFKVTEVHLRLSIFRTGKHKGDLLHGTSSTRHVIINYNSITFE